MKKIILSLCAATAVLGFTACGNKAQNNDMTEQDIALGDSLSTAFGEYLGANFRAQFEQQLANMSEEQRASFNKAEFIRGVKAVANRDTASLAYIMGVSCGMNMWQASKGIPEQIKVPANSAKMIEGLEKVFNADSIGNAYTYQMAFQQLMGRAQEYGNAKEEARLAATPEAQENVEKGTAYADSLVNNEGFTRAESGLVYKIENPGGEKKALRNDRIKLRYVGKHIDGSVFDQSRDEYMNAYVGNFIPGFTEGLQLLGEGGKATLVIPADIAYGVRGQGETIGKNETLVFDVEIVEIETQH